METKANINVTPLIDILLVLLITFMVVSPTKPYDFKTELPEAPGAGKIITQNPLPVLISLGKDLEISINGERAGPISEPAAMGQKLKAIFEKKAKNGETRKAVFLKAPKSVPYGIIVAVIDAAKENGATPISLQIDGLDR